MEQHVQDGTGANSCTNANIYENNCKHRLSCGVCELTNKKCPLLWSPNDYQPYVTWDVNYTTNGLKGETININDFKREGE